MNKKESLILKLKLKKDIESVNRLFSNIFFDGYLGFNVIYEDRVYEKDYSSVVGLLENSQINSFRLKPSKIIEINNLASKKIIKLIDEYLNSDIVCLFRSRETIEQYSGFAKVDKVIFLEKYEQYTNKKDVEFQDILFNMSMNEFIYYTCNKSSTLIYVYMGRIIDNKFVEITGNG